jgi:hypothetical protein
VPAKRRYAEKMLNRVQVVVVLRACSSSPRIVASGLLEGQIVWISNKN